MLNDNGYETLVYTKPEKALKGADKMKPDIILFDVNVNGEYGLKFAKKISHLSKKHKIPVVGLTTFCDNINCLSLKQKTGIKVCLIKPINPIEILSVIEKFLEEKKKNNDR